MKNKIRFVLLSLMITSLMSCDSKPENSKKPIISDGKPPFLMKMVVVDSQAYVTIRETVAKENMDGIHGRIFGELANYILQNGGTPSPKPIAIFYSNSDKEVDVELGIAVPKIIEGNERIQYKMMNTRNALVVSHFGNYTELGSTYTLIMKYLEENKLETNGAPWEEYVTDPSKEPDMTKWDTKIYFPIP